MKKKSTFNLKSITVAAYFITALLFVVLAVYMLAFKDNNVYSARDIGSYKTVENYFEEEISDASAPMGVRKEYSWQIDNIDSNESCLIFYIVHSYAQVRLDDEIIYSLTAGENTSIGSSPSSNWVVVPLYQSDIGRTVTVTITPVYKAVQNREVVFKIGSRYAVFMQRLTTDLPQILLASLCIIMGILLIIVQLCFIANKRTFSFDMLYLGIFSLLVGIWRITDMRFSPIMFQNHTAALGYITLFALFLMPVPLLLFIEERYTGKSRVVLRVFALANSTFAFVSLVCQVTGVTDLREILTSCHIMFIVDIVALVAVSIVNAYKGARDRSTNSFVILIILGCITDFIYYYINNTSSGIMFTTIAFLIYALYRFTENILDINKKAYIDVKTKLYNKARWEKYINENIPDDESIGVVMMDLNGLKRVNDTLGHKMGDKMIVKFSEIMRSTFDSGDFLCRWGGDEFSVIVRNADHEKMGRYENGMYKAVEAYNSSEEEPKIHFAWGYALSTEFPDILRNELLAKADQRMYRDKQQWYDQYADV